jgi:hypothetical protein
LDSTAFSFTHPFELETSVCPTYVNYYLQLRFEICYEKDKLLDGFLTTGFEEMLPTGYATFVVTIR